jgi:glycerophosphoryl diester phosphodiesterase
MMVANTLFDTPVAHRGLHDRAKGVIENSRSAFEAAVARGFAIECDLQLTSDGVPVVFHDDDLERLTGLSGPVSGISSEIFCTTPLLGSANGDSPQRFADFLAQIDGRVLLQIELKRQSGAAATQTLARRAAEALASYAGPVTIESFDPEQLILIREHGFKGPRGIITYAYDNPEWDEGMSDAERTMLRDLTHAPQTQFDFISCFQHSLNLQSVMHWRAQGKPVTAWTVRSMQEALAAASGSDQIVFEGFDPQSV